MWQKNKNSIFFLLVVFLIGLASGFGGGLLGEMYLFKGGYYLSALSNVSLTGENGALVIRDARKVVVEQDTRTAEAISLAGKSLVGIFKKLPAPAAGKEAGIDLAEYYYLAAPLGQGMIVSSDGWILTDFSPASLGSGKKGTVQPLTDNLVIITADRKIYEVKEFAADSLTGFNFLRIDAKDLPVLSFAESKTVAEGQAVLAVNWSGETLASYISEKADKTGLPVRQAGLSAGQAGGKVFSSEALPFYLKIAADIPDNFQGSFFFNLAGEVVGLVGPDKNIEPIYHLSAAVTSLFKYREIRRPSLGVYYIDLTDWLLPSSQSKPLKGALLAKGSGGKAVVKGSRAEAAGLKEGDIILTVEGLEIGQENNLTETVNRFIAGEKVLIEYLRGQEKKEIEIELGSR